MNDAFRLFTEHMRLDPETGLLWWIKPGKARILNKPIGTVNSRGYLSVSLLGRRYRGSHVVWLLHTGKWPEDQLDHINRKTYDNRPVNLREVSQSQNNYNYKVRSEYGASGIFQVKGGKYRAMLGRKLLGFYSTVEEAVAIRKMHEEDLFK